MKKFFGILFLLVIVAAGVCAYFFPGIPYKYKCTHELQLTDSIWETIPDDLPPLPADYTDYSSFGLRLTAWDDMKPMRTDDKSEAKWQNGDDTHYIIINELNISESDDFLDRTGISKEALDRYCKAVEKTTPENGYEFTKLKMSLTMEDFDIHDFKNSKTFYLMMKEKNEAYFGENNPKVYYSVDGVGFRGCLHIEKVSDYNMAYIDIYPERDKKTKYRIGIKVTDTNEILAIANSIKLT
ncbi:MAG: hypothetical protein IJL33_02675 [Ruminococcus sp.]|nr:hypothetical protein [Ruminococcus sp.]